jgi:hypothetical protein
MVIDVVPHRNGHGGRPTGQGFFKIWHLDFAWQPRHRASPSGGLEITESLLMNDAECAAATLRTLKALGGQVAIDDFGADYSSLRGRRKTRWPRKLPSSIDHTAS